MIKETKIGGRFCQNQWILVLMFLSFFIPQLSFAKDKIEKDSTEPNIYISEGVVLYDTEQSTGIAHISETPAQAKKTPKPSYSLDAKKKQKSDTVKHTKTDIQNLPEHLKSNAESDKVLTVLRASSLAFTISENHHQPKAIAQHYLPLDEPGAIYNKKDNSLSTICNRAYETFSDTDFARPPPFYLV